MERLPIPAQESMDVANVAAHATPPSCRTRPYSLWIFVLVAVNLFVAAECHIRGGHGPHMDVHRGTVSPPPSPQFDPSHSADVTALAGTTAILNCRVHNIKNHTVSWIRHRDIHLLTVGSYTYTSDQRFRALHMDDSDDWVLKIKFVQIRDSGIYECQISTTPPVSHFIRLKVVKPYTHVLGGPDMYINKGSTINLTCVVEFSPEPPDFIYWNHNDKVTWLICVVFAASSTRMSWDGGEKLFALVRVVSVSGEHPAAMQHGGQGTYTSSSLRNILSLLSVLAALHRVLHKKALHTRHGLLCGHLNRDCHIKLEDGFASSSNVTQPAHQRRLGTLELNLCNQGILKYICILEDGFASSSNVTQPAHQRRLGTLELNLCNINRNEEHVWTGLWIEGAPNSHFERYIGIAQLMTSSSNNELPHSRLVGNSGLETLITGS
ncbi:uncharacterized protein LOC134762190 [Penaeus indicus]|uniref:uncharacterized protein LOC134762190 n=1 Tax=Penaeus indicus TaxID=29960 RepID=UPI00300CDED8